MMMMTMTIMTMTIDDHYSNKDCKNWIVDTLQAIMQQKKKLREIN